MKIIDTHFRPVVIECTRVIIENPETHSYLDADTSVMLISILFSSTLSKTCHNIISLHDRPSFCRH